MLGRLSPTLLPWISAYGLLLLLGLGGAFGLLSFHRGTRPPFLDPGFEAHCSRPSFGMDGVLHLAGSESNLPLTRALVRAFNSVSGAPRARVHQQIGSLGGIQATLDGVISLGLVSRPLSAAERRELSVVIPYARVAVVVAANPSVPESSLSRAELLDLYRGARPRWSDDSPVEVLQRERGDPDHRAVERALPAFATVNDEAYRHQRWRVVYHDAEMRRSLQSTRGALGLLEVGALEAGQLAVKVLRIDGVTPTDQDVARGKYPFTKDLALVSRGPLTGAGARLVAFFFSAPGQRLIRARGYVALPRGKP